MSIAKKVAGQSGWFLVGNLYTLFVGFAFQIYLARHIGAEGLGVFGLLQAGVTAASGLLGLGIAQVMVRFIPEHVRKQEYAELHALVKGGFALLAGMGLLGVAVVYSGLPLLVSHWPELGGRESEVLAGAIMLPLGLLLHASTQALRGFFDIRYVVMGSSILQLTAKVVFSIMAFATGYYLMGYLWAVNASMAIAVAWMLRGIYIHLQRHPVSTGAEKVGFLSEWRRYAKVMYGNSLLGFWAQPLERFIVGLTVSSAAVGVLVVANTLYMLPAVFLQMFLAIVGPMMAASASERNFGEVGHIYHLSTDWLVRLSLPLIVFFAFMATPVLELYGASFAAQGVWLLRLLVVGQLFNLMAGPIGNVLNMCGQERKMFVINTGSLLLRAALLLTLVPTLGLNGIGIVVCVILFSTNIVGIIVARKELGVHWWHRKYRAWLLPAIFTSAVAWGLQGVSLSTLALVACLPLLYLVFHGSYILIHGFNPEDREVLAAVRAKLPPGIAKYV